MNRHNVLGLMLGVVLCAVSCGTDEDDGAGGTSGGGLAGSACAPGSEGRCSGKIAYTCAGGVWRENFNCGDYADCECRDVVAGGYSFPHCLRTGTTESCQ